jgi:prepilin-type N-terminal cleavage/methylation domain-containing protein/prepilin-type processing-associated H-X9-DG protein
MNSAMLKPRVGAGAFTLIELLVVIAVIGILAAVLLPALVRARVQAGITVCENNLRQQELGLAMYTSDFAAYPLYAGPNGYWMQSLVPYVRSEWPTDDTVGGVSGPVYSQAPLKSIYTCPGYDRIDGVYSRHGIWVGAYAYNGGAEGAVLNQEFWTAGHNTLLISGGLGGETTGPTRESAVLAPSEMIAVGDSEITPVDGAPNSVIGLPSAPYFPMEFRVLPPGTGVQPPPPGAAARAMISRHGDRWNMAFCDGHIEDGPPEKFLNSYSDAVLALWNPDHRAHWEQ